MPSFSEKDSPIMPELIAIMATVTAVLGGAYGVITAAKKITPTVRLIVGVFGDFAGEPERPGVPARPGVMERLASIDAKVSSQGERLDEHGKQLAEIHHELHPNSGKSSRDILDRLDRANERANTARTTTVTITPAEQPETD